MDREQARFILRSFRPDGADAGDHDFAGALKLAMEDRELGAWLASERAFDAAFSEALGSLPLPDGLRDDILAYLAAERGDMPQAEDGHDAAWIGAFASIQPPAAMRDELIAAMERTAGKPPNVVPVFWRRAGIPLAAAAGIALAFILVRKEEAPLAFVPSRMPVAAVQAGFIRTIESPLFSLDMTREDHDQLLDHLAKNQLPCPSTLPPGLRDVKGIGCRELVIDGKHGSLICFDEKENGTVHLVIFKRRDVEGELPDRQQPSISQDGNWAVARWADAENVFVLMGTTQAAKLAALF